MNRTIRAIGLALALSGALGGCAFFDTIGKVQTAAASPVASQVDTVTLSQRVYAAKAGYASTLAFATVYARQPRCGTAGAPVAPLCSSQDALNAMRKMSAAADAATQGAEDVIRTTPDNATLWAAAVGAAEQSVAVFKTLVSIYKPEAAK